MVPSYLSNHTQSVNFSQRIRMDSEFTDSKSIKSVSWISDWIWKISQIHFKIHKLRNFNGFGKIYNVVIFKLSRPS